MYHTIIIFCRDNLAESEFNYENNFKTHQVIEKK